MLDDWFQAKDELRSESQMRAKQETTFDRMQEQLRAKEDELNRMRLAMDESNDHRNHFTTTKKSLPDRTKSAPHFGGVHRKVAISSSDIRQGEDCILFSVTFQTISASK